MRTTKPVRRAAAQPWGAGEAEDADSLLGEEAEGDLVRVVCGDCRRPVALSRAADALPEHALCSTPWNPFGLTVCPGSGRPVAGDGDALPVVAAHGGEGAAGFTLPESLDWRLQPFSHAGGGPRPLRAHGMRQAA